MGAGKHRAPAVDKTNEHLHALTGLRFIAAFLVFVHHLDGRTGVADTDMPLGAYAVGFFFVLSGFILTYVHGRRTFEVRRFVFSRWARIWPLHFVALLLTLALFAQHRTQLDESPLEWLRLGANATLLHSWIPLNEWSFSFNQVSWSISTELFFYATFPFLVGGGERRFWRTYPFILGLTVLAGFGLRWLAVSTSVGETIDFERITQTNPLFRLVEFASGAAFGFVFLRRRDREPQPGQSRWLDRRVAATILETALIIFVVALAFYLREGRILSAISDLSGERDVLSNWFRFSGGVFVFALIVFVFGSSRGCWSQLFGSKPMVFLGEISFAFYMIHFLVLRWLRTTDWSASGIPPVLIGLSALLISLGLSMVLFRTVEGPFRAALLEIYDGRARKALSTAVSGLTGFLRSRAAPLAISLLVVPVVLLSSNYEPVEYSPEMREIRRDSSRVHRAVHLENGLRMAGLRATADERGVTVEIVWQRNYNETVTRRISQLLDNDGEVVRNGPAVNGEYYQDQDLGVPFIETIFFADAVLAEASSVRIGFRNEGRRVMRVEILSIEDVRDLDVVR